MAEIIGVAASATQLGTACFSLIDVLRKIKGGASTLKRYHEQLQELQSLSTCISQNPLLQTPEIGIQTRALLSLIDNNCVTSLLSKGRLLRTWGLLYKEQDLLDIFVKLERQKSTLSLTIEEIQSKTLYQIQSDIQNMADKKTTYTGKAQTGDKNQPKILVEDGTCEKPSLNIQISPIDLLYNRMAADIQSALTLQNPMLSPLSLVNSIIGSSANMNEGKDPSSSDRRGPQWNNCKAGPGVHQENRRIYKINGKLSEELAKGTPNPCIFNRPVKVGKGNQNNCNYVKFVGDVTGAVEPNMDGVQWIDPDFQGSASQEQQTEILGTQFNGIVIEYEEAPKTDAKRG